MVSLWICVSVQLPFQSARTHCDHGESTPLEVDMEVDMEVEWKWKCPTRAQQITDIPIKLPMV